MLSILEKPNTNYMRMGKFDLKDKSEQGFIKYVEHAHLHIIIEYHFLQQKHFIAQPIMQPPTAIIAIIKIH